MEYLKLVTDFIDNSVILNSTFSALVQHEHNIKNNTVECHTWLSSLLSLYSICASRYKGEIQLNW